MNALDSTRERRRVMAIDHERFTYLEAIRGDAGLPMLIYARATTTLLAVLAIVGLVTLVS